jgi:acetyltransferase
MPIQQIHRFFHPKTVAVIGASDRPDSVGHSIFKNIKDSDFSGKVYPVNNRAKTVMGCPAGASIADIKEPVDLAIIATPAPTVPAIVEECGKAGVAGAIIISSGFREAGTEGQKMFNKIVASAKKHNIKILGPNCLGFINPRIGLNASFAPEIPNPGTIAFVSQSGALCDTFLDWSLGDNVGFSYFVSIGSMADISFDELIDYFDTDPNVTSILLYMESINDARKFMSSARAFSRNKPIVALKAGLGEAGARAVASHTGTLAGDDKVFDAAFRRAGIIRAETVSELFNYAKTLNRGKLANGNRLAIITNAGGAAVVSTDFLTARGGRLAQLSASTIDNLDVVMPPAWSRNNPIDVLGDGQPRHYQAAVKACLEDPNVDGIMVILTPQAVTRDGATAQAITSLPGINSKPVFASFMGAHRVKDGVDILLKAGIPVYRTPEKAIACFLGINNWHENLADIEATPEAVPAEFTPDKPTAQKLIDRAIRENQSTIAGAAAAKFLSCYGLPANPSYLVNNPNQAAAIAKKLGFPVAMKLQAAGLLHKTELGGVRLGIRSANSARLAYRDIMSRAKDALSHEAIEGITVERMVGKKFEIIVGGKRDPIFGPVVVFGMGGVAVEVFNDIAIGLPPLNMALAKNLMKQTKIYTLLKGYRNQAGVNIRELQFFLYKFSYLLADLPQVKEIDINPIAADIDGMVIVDAKIVIDPQVVVDPKKPHAHLAILPYVKEYEDNITIGNGQKILLRPIMAEDEPRHREFIANLSQDSKRFRFFEVIDRPDAKFVRHFTQIDYDREIAIIAEIDQKGVKTTIGVARLIENVLDNTAEFAIVVADAWQQKGLGTKLTAHMARIAKRKGIAMVYINFLKDNYAMKLLAAQAGFVIKETPDCYYAQLSVK